MIAITGARDCAQAATHRRETISGWEWEPGNVGSVLRNQNVWLALVYATLILLLTRTYA